MLKNGIPKTSPTSPIQKKYSRALKISKIDDFKESIKDLDNYCQQFAKEYFLSDSVWILFSNVTKKIPNEIKDEDFFLRNNKSLYLEDNIMPENQTLEMSRAGEFARAMLSRGVPPDSVSVGINPGDPKKVSIWFYVRSIDDTYLKFVQPYKVEVK